MEDISKYLNNLFLVHLHKEPENEKEKELVKELEVKKPRKKPKKTEEQLFYVKKKEEKK